MWAKVAIGTLTIPIFADTIAQVEHESDWENVIVACELNEWLARFGLDVGGVNNGQFTGRKTFSGDEVQDLEGIFRRGLIVFIV